MLSAYFERAECAASLIRSGLGDPARTLRWGGNDLTVALIDDYFRSSNAELAEILASVSDCRSPRVGAGDTLLIVRARNGDARAVHTLLERSDPDDVDEQGHAAIGAPRSAHLTLRRPSYDKWRSLRAAPKRDARHSPQTLQGKP